jgi:hypothetical protein
MRRLCTILAAASLPFILAESAVARSAAGGRESYDLYSPEPIEPTSVPAPEPKLPLEPTSVPAPEPKPEPVSAAAPTLSAAAPGPITAADTSPTFGCDHLKRYSDIAALTQDSAVTGQFQAALTGYCATGSGPSTTWRYQNGQVISYTPNTSGSTWYNPNGSVLTYYGGQAGATVRYPNNQVATYYYAQSGATYYYPSGQVLTYYAGQKGVTYYHSNGRVLSYYFGNAGASWYNADGSTLTSNGPEIPASELLYPATALKDNAAGAGALGCTLIPSFLKLAKLYGDTAQTGLLQDLQNTYCGTTLASASSAKAGDVAAASLNATWRYSNGTTATYSSDEVGATWYWPNGKVITYDAGETGASWYYPNASVATYDYGETGGSWYWPNGNVITYDAGEVGASWYHSNGRVLSYDFGQTGATWYRADGTTWITNGPAIPASALLYPIDVLFDSGVLGLGYACNLLETYLTLGRMEGDAAVITQMNGLYQANCASIAGNWSKEESAEAAMVSEPLGATATASAWYYPNGTVATYDAMTQGSTWYYPNGRTITSSAGRADSTVYYPNGAAATHRWDVLGAGWYYPNGALITSNAGATGATWYHANGRTISSSFGTAGATWYLDDGAVWTSSGPALPSASLLNPPLQLFASDIPIPGTGCRALTHYIALARLQGDASQADVMAALKTAKCASTTGVSGGPWTYSNGRTAVSAPDVLGSQWAYPNGTVVTEDGGLVGGAWRYPNGNTASSAAGARCAGWKYATGQDITPCAGSTGQTWRHPNGAVLSSSMGQAGGTWLNPDGTVWTSNAPAYSTAELAFPAEVLLDARSRCFFAAPVLTFSLANPLTGPSTAVGFSLSVKNMNTASCGTTRFNLSMTLPASDWSWALNAPLTQGYADIAPGQTAQLPGTLQIPAAAQTSTYSFQMSVASTLSPAATLKVDATGPDAPGGVRGAYDSASRALTLEWNVAADALSGMGGYRVYRDDVLVASVTALSFSEGVPAGTHVYTVRAYDQWGNLSAASSAFLAGGNGGPTFRCPGKRPRGTMCWTGGPDSPEPEPTVTPTPEPTVEPVPQPRPVLRENRDSDPAFFWQLWRRFWTRDEPLS